MNSNKLALNIIDSKFVLSPQETEVQDSSETSGTISFSVIVNLYPPIIE